jgi:hypothetical protein
MAIAVAMAIGLVAPASAKTLVIYMADGQRVDAFDAFSGAQLSGIDPPYGESYDVAVDGNGNVYVTGRLNNQEPAIYEFAPNATDPDFTYQVPARNLPLLAVDAAGDLTTVVYSLGSLPLHYSFVSYMHGEGGPIRTVPTRVAYPPGSLQKPVIGPDGTAWAMPSDLHGRVVAMEAPQATSVAFVHVAGRFAPTGGIITVDRAGDLLVMEGPVVTQFDGLTGNIRASVPIAGTFDGYQAMALSPDEKHLFVETQHGTISIYAWPAGGVPITTYAATKTVVAFALGYR